MIMNCQYALHKFTMLDMYKICSAKNVPTIIFLHNKIFYSLTLAVTLKQGPVTMIGRFPMMSTNVGVVRSCIRVGSFPTLQPLMLFVLSSRNANFPGDGVGKLDSEGILMILFEHEYGVEIKFIPFPASNPTCESRLQIS